MATRRSHNYRITSLQNVPLEGSVKLNQDTLKSSTDKNIIFPTDGGRLLTDADLANLNMGNPIVVNRLVSYLESWALAGNITMHDIRQYVNDNAHHYQFTCVAIDGLVYTYHIDKVDSGAAFQSIRALNTESQAIENLRVTINDDNTISFNLTGYELNSLEIVYADAAEVEVIIPLNTELNSVTIHPPEEEDDDEGGDNDEGNDGGNEGEGGNEGGNEGEGNNDDPQNPPQEPQQPPVENNDEGNDENNNDDPQNPPEPGNEGEGDNEGGETDPVVTEPPVDDPENNGE